MLNISENNISKATTNEFNDYLSSVLSNPRSTRVIRRWMLSFFIIFIVVLFLPWQQNINGKGAITALTPQDRPQTIQNTIDGQIVEWFVREGQLVQKGDTILEIREIKDDYFDPNIIERFDEQITAKNDGLDSYGQKIAALNNQVSALEANLRLSLAKAKNKISQNRTKVVSDSIDVVNENLQVKIAQDRYERGLTQYEKQIFSLQDLESRKLKVQETQTKLLSVQNKLSISKQELINSQIEFNAVSAEYNEKLAKARSDIGSAKASLADGENELSKLKNKKSSVEVRRGYYIVRAPQTGYVVKTLKAGIGETIKQGESICTLQPTNPQVAVELYVRAMDVPLISKGREVRLEFEGWPALQFSGWPSVAVGTFGGTVTVIDFVDSKNGEYRLLVTPKVGDEEWPEQLRVGSGVFGWVMLENVPVWYELWRQLNAFPPSLKANPDGDYEEGKSDEKAKK
ncbi:MAG: HlyD family secretion protein [Spirosomaceae bacterium]|nr:HlyD family secretion protein [Spirosomataceae bacterium]